MNDKELTEREIIKPLKLYWIYDEDDYFLGGNPCPVGMEHFAEDHLKWLSKKHLGKLRIEWEEGTFTYQESYIQSREKCEAVQRDQPGIRDNWNSAKLSWEIAKLADFTEVARVRIARKKDAKERDQLGTDDQKVIDEARSGKKQIPRGKYCPEDCHDLKKILPGPAKCRNYDVDLEWSILEGTAYRCAECLNEEKEGGRS